ncbi:hypothetical protein ACF1FY_01065 [Streptomyces althioticus]|uniref:hypothetical protein n=1 Tax=Streptomyces althioticus TaxID=83380 RepID=UPI0036FEC5C9
MNNNAHDVLVELLREDAGTQEGQSRPTPQEWEQHMAGIAARAALEEETGESDYEQSVDTGRVRVALRISVTALVVAISAAVLVLAFVGTAAAVGMTAVAVIGACIPLLVARLWRDSPTSAAGIVGLPQRHTR